MVRQAMWFCIGETTMYLEFFKKFPNWKELATERERRILLLRKPCITPRQVCKKFELAIKYAA